MTFDINTILDDLKQGAIDAAQATALDLLKEAAEDALAFVEASVPNLARYLSLRAEGKINDQELESLILGLRDLAEMSGLTLAGLGAIKVQAIRDSILKSVTQVALGAVKGLV